LCHVDLVSSLPPSSTHSLTTLSHYSPALSCQACSNQMHSLTYTRHACHHIPTVISSEEDGSVQNVGIVKHPCRRERSRTLLLLLCCCAIVLVFWLFVAFEPPRSVLTTFHIWQLGICQSAPKPSSHAKSTENIYSGLVSLLHLFTTVDYLPLYCT
jgi:hypothetical protein